MMRRKRWYHQWSFWFVAVGGIAIAAGIVYLQKKFPNGPEPSRKTASESAQVEKKSALKGDSKAKKSKVHETALKEHEQGSSYEERVQKQIDLSVRALRPGEPAKPVESFDLSEKFNRNANHCEAFESAGADPRLGFAKVVVNDQDWAKVTSHFYSAKGALLKWFANHSTQVSVSTAQLMKNRIEKLKLERPPYANEPDLAWRGTGYWSLDDSSEPRVRIGNGFLKLVLEHPERAQFELTRLVAQTWAPCELKRLGAHFAWESLLGCFKFTEHRACEGGTYSESGWIVSSVLATKVAPMKCTIPALQSKEARTCVETLPLKALPGTAGTSAKLEGAPWMEASR